MPIKNKEIHDIVASYLEPEEQELVSKAVESIATDTSLKLYLPLEKKFPPAHLFEAGIRPVISNSFIYFYNDFTNNKTNTFKLHLSVHKNDYAKILADPDFNHYLQKNLIAVGDETMLFRYKLVDSVKLNQGIVLAKQIEKILNNFFIQVAAHNSAAPTNFAQKAKYYQSAHKLFTYLQKQTGSLGGALKDLNSYLEADAEELEKLKKIAQAGFVEIIESYYRLEKEVQYTFYINRDARIETMIRFVSEISERLRAANIQAVPCPSSDKAINEYFSLRLDRLKIGGPYISYDSENIAMTLEAIENLEAYQSLKAALHGVAQQSKPGGSGAKY